MSIDAMKKMVAALETCTEGDYSTGHVIPPSFDEEAVADAIAAGVAAIEAAERQEPVATIHDDGHWTHKPGKDPLDQFSGKRRMDVFTAPQPSIPALLYEAHDYGQFADDFDRPLAKPIRKAIRDMLTRYTPPDEAQEREPATTAREAFWKAALGNNTKLANLAKAAIAEAEKSRPAQQTSYQEYKEYKRKRLEDAGFLKFPLRGAIPQPAPAGMVLVKKSDLQKAYSMACWNAHDQRCAQHLATMLAAAPKEMK